MSTRYFYYCIAGALFLLLIISGCSNVSGHTSITLRDHRAVSPVVSPSTGVNQESTVQFTLSGGYQAKDTLSVPIPTSKLRHGHREFTINVANADISFFIVFYGYQGPGNYTLSQYLNGGDVHIGLLKDGPSWDLSLQTQARCMMTVASDVPIAGTDLDRMQGTFTCPRLFSSAPEHPEPPVSVEKGAFDVAIIIES